MPINGRDLKPISIDENPDNKKGENNENNNSLDYISLIIWKFICV